MGGRSGCYSDLDRCLKGKLKDLWCPGGAGAHTGVRTAIKRMIKGSFLRRVQHPKA